MDVDSLQDIQQELQEELQEELRLPFDTWTWLQFYVYLYASITLQVFLRQ